jgi:hypothetical protein
MDDPYPEVSDRLRVLCSQCKKLLVAPEYKTTIYALMDLQVKVIDHLKFHCPVTKNRLISDIECYELAEPMMKKAK